MKLNEDWFFELSISFIFFLFRFRYDICTYKNQPCGTLGKQPFYFHFWRLVAVVNILLLFFKVWSQRHSFFNPFILLYGALRSREWVEKGLAAKLLFFSCCTIKQWNYKRYWDESKTPSKLSVLCLLQWRKWIIGFCNSPYDGWPLQSPLSLPCAVWGKDMHSTKGLI